MSTMSSSKAYLAWVILNQELSFSRAFTAYGMDLHRAYLFLFLVSGCGSHPCGCIPERLFKDTE